MHGCFHSGNAYWLAQVVYKCMKRVSHAFFVTKATCSWTFTEGARITRKIGTSTKDKGDEVMRDVPEGT